jgi:DNA invertase Pin-like site-specific DNA recombinase
VAAVDELATAKAGIAEAQRDAVAIVAKARTREREARARLHERLVRAAEAGIRQSELVKATGLTREAVRRILRAGGVGPD